MKDLQREIVNQVASGTISPEEGAARLEGLEAGPSPVTTPTPSAGPKQVKVVSGFGDDSFEFIRRAGRANAFGETLTIRMNPTVPLVARVQAGNVRIDGIHSALTAEVQAGNCRVNDFRGPIRLRVVAGNVEASGRLDSGASSIRCNMGEVRVSLARRSSVTITARTTMGDVAIEGEGITHSGSNQAMLGDGAGTLEIDCTLGSVH